LRHAEDELTPRSQGRFDRYELVRQTARGGMAALWQARLLGAHGFQKIVAIKTVLPHLADDPRFRNMLLTEANIASRIDHPNVALILDLGERDDVPYLVEEWIDGPSLAEIGRYLAPVRDALGTRVIARILADACAGLHAAHELRDEEGNFLSVVHRDMSPGNILVDRHGVAKVIDFGLAKATGIADEDTDPDVLKGKVTYMSPEYVNDHWVDRRADIWAVGVILYRFLTGKLPFDSDSPTETLRQLASGPAPPPLPATVPASLAGVVARALAPDPNDRFATAAKLGEALDEAMRPLGGPVSSTVVADYIALNVVAARREREAARARHSSASSARNSAMRSAIMSVGR
jgi:serine/threonine-protein kinase